MGDANWGPTKVKKGNKILFLLWKDLTISNYEYGSIRYEDTVINIDQDGKLNSLSNEPVVAKYEGTNIELLEKDIIMALKKQNTIN